MAPKSHSSAQAVRVQPLLSRKRDVFHVVFLSAITFLAFAIDFVPAYPAQLPPWATTIYNYYRTELNDPLYAKDPPFFQFYVVLEAIYAVPTCLYCIWGLIRGNNPMIPVYSLIFATHLVLSTVVCLVEVWADNDWPKEVIDKNVPGYLVFFVAATFLWTDMFIRVRRSVLAKEKTN